MITAIIFTAHLIFILIIFTKKWQNESLQTAFVNLALIVILFSVGWSIATMILKIFVDESGLGIHFDRDTMSLTLLTLVEFFFYKIYYADEFTVTDKGK